MNAVLARLAQIEERVAKATPGPWFPVEYSHGGLGVKQDERRVYAVDICGDGRCRDLSPWTPQSKERRWSSRVIAQIKDWCQWNDHPANRDFMCHSRTDVPALTNLVRALLAEHWCVGSPEAHLEARAAAARAIAEFGNTPEKNEKLRP